MRAIVHKTRGKLDLRSLTVFGLNAKPNTDTPIGYFGTGLKYAIAVLARYRIPVTFWIDGKKWTVEKDETKFRDKEFVSLFLKRHTLVPKIIALPFTTDLGKGWDIWQAFRELECNTRDEKGMTFIGECREDGSVYRLEGVEPECQTRDRGYTCIVVQDEQYIQEYLNRYTHFLEDGMTVQETTDRLQVFPRKSMYIYYRGVRIYDLKEPTANTYNFLCKVDLTEDRTAKYPFVLDMEIENYIGQKTQDKEIIRRAVTAPARTYEAGLDYSYTSRSDIFLDTVEESKEDATDFAKSILRRDRSVEEPRPYFAEWTDELIWCIQKGDYSRIESIVSPRREQLIRIIQEGIKVRDSLENKTAEEIKNANPSQAEGVTRPEVQVEGAVEKYGSRPAAGPAQEDDNISF